MGLDVFAGRRVYHFNKAAREAFQAWCSEQGLPDPFPGYEDRPAGARLDIPSAQQWMAAFASQFPSDLADRRGRSWQQLMKASREIGTAEDGHVLSEAETFWEYGRRTGIAWYASLQDAFERGEHPFYC